MILQMIYISLIAIYISDLSGFAESAREWVAQRLRKPIRRLRPLDCPTCLVWWALLAYLAATGRFALEYVALAAAFSLLALPAAMFIRAATEVLNAISEKLHELADKL